MGKIKFKFLEEEKKKKILDFRSLKYNGEGYLCINQLVLMEKRVELKKRVMSKLQNLILLQELYGGVNVLIGFNEICLVVCLLGCLIILDFFNNGLLNELVRVMIVCNSN